ncbi:conserved hypothetical protein [Streptococcus intermedius JTH08]|nr:conserved hypothetical protein [Streptococcus intermedius JTH08]
MTLTLALFSDLVTDLGFIIWKMDLVAAKVKFFMTASILVSVRFVLKCWIWTACLKESAIFISVASQLPLMSKSVKCYYVFCKKQSKGTSPFLWISTCALK